MNQFSLQDYENKKSESNLFLSMNSQEIPISSLGTFHNLCNHNYVEGDHQNNLTSIDSSLKLNNSLSTSNIPNRRRIKRKSGGINEKKLISGNENDNNQDISGDISTVYDVNSMKTVNYSVMVGDVNRDNTYMQNKAHSNLMYQQETLNVPYINNYQIDPRLKTVNSSGTSFINYSQGYPMLISSTMGQQFIIGQPNLDSIQTNSLRNQSMKSLRTQNIAFTQPNVASESRLTNDDDKIKGTNRRYVNKTANNYSHQTKGQNEMSMDVNDSSLVNHEYMYHNAMPLASNYPINVIQDSSGVIGTSQIPMQIIPIQQNPVLINNQLNFNVKNISTCPQYRLAQFPPGYSPIVSSEKSSNQFPMNPEQNKVFISYDKTAVEPNYNINGNEIYDPGRYYNQKNEYLLNRPQQYSSNNELESKLGSNMPILLQTDLINDTKPPNNYTDGKNSSINQTVYYAQTNSTCTSLEKSTDSRVTKKGKFTVKTVKTTDSPVDKDYDACGVSSDNLQSELDENLKPKSRFKKTRIREKIERWCTDGFSALDFRFTLIPEKILELHKNKPDYSLKEINYELCDNCENNKDHQYYSPGSDYHKKDFKFWNKGERISIYSAADEQNENFCDFHSKFLKLASQNESLSCVNITEQQPTPSNSPKTQAPLNMINQMPVYTHPLSASWNLSNRTNSSQSQFSPSSADFEPPSINTQTNVNVPNIAAIGSIFTPDQLQQQQHIQHQFQHQSTPKLIPQQLSPHTAMVMVNAPIILSGNHNYSDNPVGISQFSALNNIDEPMGIYAHPVIMQATSPIQLDSANHHPNTYVTSTMIAQRFASPTESNEYFYQQQLQTQSQQPDIDNVNITNGSSSIITDNKPPGYSVIQKVVPLLQSPISSPIPPQHQQQTQLYTVNNINNSPQYLYPIRHHNDPSSSSFFPMPSTSPIAQPHSTSQLSRPIEMLSVDTNSDVATGVSNVQQNELNCNSTDQITQIDPLLTNQMTPPVHKDVNYNFQSNTFSMELDRSLNQFKLGIRQLFNSEYQRMYNERRELVSKNERLKIELNRVCERVKHLEGLLDRRKHTGYSATLPDTKKDFVESTINTLSTATINKTDVGVTSVAADVVTTNEVPPSTNQLLIITNNTNNSVTLPINDPDQTGPMSSVFNATSSSNSSNISESSSSSSDVSPNSSVHSSVGSGSNSSLNVPTT